MLLLNANRVVPVDRLAEDLYGDAMPASALTQIQAHISQLRRLLDPDHGPAGARGSVVETRAPGYLLRLAPEQLDLRRFERGAAEAADASARADHEQAARLLRGALELWRGPALADFAGDPFAEPAIARLEEMRIGAIEDQIDADLARGRHAERVGELEALVSEHPFRERVRGQLMVALYRSGRQAEALAVYRRTREVLIAELGIEPSSALQALERAILTHDASLELAGSAAPPPASPRSALVVDTSGGAAFEALVAVAAPLARLPERELILVRPVGDESALAPASAAVNARRRTLGVPARAASFVSAEPTGDIVRLAISYDVDLLLVDEPGSLDGRRVPRRLAELFERSPADVAALTGPSVEPGMPRGVFVPFGGGEHDWAAVELAALLASAEGAPLRLVGTRAQPVRPDASRLLADASLAVQRLIDVEAEPILAEPTEEGLVDAVAGGSLVVVGISPRWRSDGIGGTRRALLRAGLPILLVHRGPRPGALTPRAERTRFTWSLQR
jgi:DNA-binding SARP family transcriptional activator